MNEQYTNSYIYFAQQIELATNDKIEICLDYAIKISMQLTTNYILNNYECSSLKAFILVTEIKNNYLYNRKQLKNIPF